MSDFDWCEGADQHHQNWFQAACRDDIDNEIHQNEDGVVVVESTSSLANEKMVTWRGNLVSEGKAKVLKHVFDDFEDHFGHQRPDPNVKFILNELRHECRDLWFSDFSFDYMIDCKVYNLDYISIDLCIDLVPKRSCTQNGNSKFEDYGKSWVYCYVPEVTMEKVKSYVKAGTSWDATDARTVFDPNRNLVAIEAKIGIGCSFWVASDPSNAKAEEQFSRIGSVQHVGSQPTHQRLHRGIGMCSVSSGAVGPTPGTGEGEGASLTFTLVSIRTWEVTNFIAPIIHSPTNDKS